MSASSKHDKLKMHLVCPVTKKNWVVKRKHSQSDKTSMRDSQLKQVHTHTMLFPSLFDAISGRCWVGSQSSCWTDIKINVWFTSEYSRVLSVLVFHDVTEDLDWTCSGDLSDVLSPPMPAPFWFNRTENDQPASIYPPALWLVCMQIIWRATPWSHTPRLRADIIRGYNHFSHKKMDPMLLSNHCCDGGSRAEAWYDVSEIPVLPPHPLQSSITMFKALIRLNMGEKSKKKKKMHWFLKEVLKLSWMKLNGQIRKGANWAFYINIYYIIIFILTWIALWSWVGLLDSFL